MDCEKSVGALGWRFIPNPFHFSVYPFVVLRQCSLKICYVFSIGLFSDLFILKPIVYPDGRIQKEMC